MEDVMLLLAVLLARLLVGSIFMVEFKNDGDEEEEGTKGDCGTTFWAEGRKG